MGRRYRNKNKGSSVGTLVMFGAVLGAGIYLLSREQNRRAIDQRLAELGLKDTLEDVGGTVSQGWEKTKQAAASGDTLGDKLSNVQSAVSEAASEVADTAKSHQGDVQAASQQLGKDAKVIIAQGEDRAADALDAAGDKAQEMSEEAKEAVADAKDKAADMAENAEKKAEEAQRSARDAAEKAQAKAAEKKAEAKSDSAKQNDQPEWPYKKDDKPSERKF